MRTARCRRSSGRGEGRTALLTALLYVVGALSDQAPSAVQRRAVVRTSPELQERGRSAESEATLLAEVGVAVFRTAFERWTGEPDGVGLRARIREEAAELAAGLGAVDFAALRREPHR
ncbi:hypothetical protein [Streptomyces sp. NPDC005538]|uniref:hypothetical protein n=1 Tax=unclassified Streptomyces TaxID=2593676 RepID=UPI0033BDAB5F